MSKKITELTELTSYATNDLLIIEDVSASTTKKITWANLIATNSLTADKLATSAITIGYAQAVATQSIAVTASTDLTSLSVTVTVPAGGRRCKITGFLPLGTASGSNNAITFRIMESTTVLSSSRTNIDTGKTEGPIFAIYSAVLSAGSHTYKLNILQDVAANVDYQMSSTSIGFILVEVI